MLPFFENWLSTTGYQFCSYHPLYISPCVASVLILRSVLFLEGRPHLLCPIVALSLVLLWCIPVNCPEVSLQRVLDDSSHMHRSLCSRNLWHVVSKRCSGLVWSPPRASLIAFSRYPCMLRQLLPIFAVVSSWYVHVAVLWERMIGWHCVCSVAASLLGDSLASDSERVAPLRRSCYLFWLFLFYA